MQALTVCGARILPLTAVHESRGTLTFGQVGQGLPFTVQRFFAVYGVPSGKSRGAHAHKTLHQLLVCLKGSCVVTLDDGQTCDEVLLNNPEMSLYVPPMIWAEQHHYSADAVLLILASDIYREDDYIRDYDQFTTAIK